MAKTVKKKTTRKPRPSELKAKAERAKKAREKAARIEAEIEAAKQKTKPPEVTPYPRAGRKIKDFEDKLDQQLSGDSQCPHQGPGRSRPVDARPPGLDQIGPAIELVVNFVKLPFELWQIRVPQVKGLALTNPEAKQIAEPARELIEYYLPKIPPIAYAWASLAVAGFWIMRTRLVAIEEYRQKIQQPPNSSVSQPMAKAKERSQKAHGGAGPSGQGITEKELKNPTI